MPELPEVETVCRGLSLALLGKKFAKVEQRRKALRFPLPARLPMRLKNRTIEALTRRAKYILIDLDDGQTLILHLGMSGRMTINPEHSDRHDHLLFEMQDGTRAVFNDPRRFGMADLCATPLLHQHRLFAHLGPEPLSSAFSTGYLAKALAHKKADIKTAIMNQKIVVGVGNIYASESLWLAGIHPERQSGDLATHEIKNLCAAIKKTLRKAIAAGGSSLRDYVQTDGKLGYFQHQWAVYDRQGQNCRKCKKAATIQKTTQAGRSTYYCNRCQR